MAQSTSSNWFNLAICFAWAGVAVMGNAFPVPVSIGLWIMAGLFFFRAFWPKETEAFFLRVPGGSYLASGLNKIDGIFLPQLDAETSQKKECLDRLGQKLLDGSGLLSRRVTNEDEFDAWMNDYRSWTDEVFRDIENNFSGYQANSVRVVAGSVQAGLMPPFFNETHNERKLRLSKRIENVRDFIRANSNH